jgi:uncharacterized membrane protein YfcA
MHFTTEGIVIICCTAFLAGVSRTAIPGLGTFLVPLIAMALPVRASTGFLLPLLIEADLMAIFYWRRKVMWRQLGLILPWTGCGVILGFFVMKQLSDTLFRPLLGGMIILFVALDFVRRRARVKIEPGNRAFVALSGILAGAFTMIANAGGPIMTIYLLTIALPKEEFVGTTAMFFCLINLFKVPFSVALGLITWPSLRIDMTLIPLIAAGGLVGAVFIKKLPQRHFDIIAQALAAIAGLKLFF